MSNHYDLNGRSAIITGGAQGIGAAIADRFLESGARVAIWDFDQGATAAFLQTREKTDRILVQHCDIADLAAVEAATQATKDAFGGLDILVNSAGIAGPNMPVWEYPPEDWDRIFAINVRGTFNTCRAVVPHMRAGAYGRIVNIASVAGKEGNPNASAYSASKAAVIGLTKSLGKELADMDIAVNCITPAAARTRIFDQMSEEHIQFMLSKIPRGRFVTVEEIADLAAFMASAECRFTTGATFDISGGRATY